MDYVGLLKVQTPADVGLDSDSAQLSDMIHIPTSSGKKHTDHRIDNQKTIVQLGVPAATYFEHSIACSLKGSLLGFEPQLLSYRLPV